MVSENPLTPQVSKITRSKRIGGVAQVVEHLLCNHKALSSNHQKKKKVKEKQKRSRGWEFWRQRHLFFSAGTPPLLVPHLLPNGNNSPFIESLFLSESIYRIQTPCFTDDETEAQRRKGFAYCHPESSQRDRENDTSCPDYFWAALCSQSGCISFRNLQVCLAVNCKEALIHRLFSPEASILPYDFLMTLPFNTLTKRL
jgi:hypothetical protein